MSADRLAAMPDERLGAALGSLRDDLDWPEAPADLDRRVLAAIEARRQVPVRRPSHRRILLIAAAIVVTIAAAAAAAKLVLDLGAITIRRGVPSQPSATSTSPFGRPVTLAAAERIAGFEALLPGSLDRPDKIWVAERDVEHGEGSDVIVFAWRPRPGLPAIEGSRWGAVQMAFRGDADLAQKFLGQGASLRLIGAVHGDDAYWVQGEHLLEIWAPDGTITVTVRGNVLFWQEGPLTMRLETALGRRAALALSRSTGTARGPAV